MQIKGKIDGEKKRIGVEMKDIVEGMVEKKQVIEEIYKRKKKGIGKYIEV